MIGEVNNTSSDRTGVTPETLTSASASVRRSCSSISVLLMTWTDCGSGYQSCAVVDDTYKTIDPYCCLEGADPGNYCEQYKIDEVICSAGAHRYANFRESSKYYAESCDTQHNCY